MGFFGPEAFWETTLGVLNGSTAICGRVTEWLGAFDELEFELEEILDLGNGVTFTVVNQRGRPAGTSSSGGYIQRQEAFIAIWHEDAIRQATTFLDIEEARSAANRLAGERA
jgi:hypothetical protein